MNNKKDIAMIEAPIVTIDNPTEEQVRMNLEKKREIAATYTSKDFNQVRDVMLRKARAAADSFGPVMRSIMRYAVELGAAMDEMAIECFLDRPVRIPRSRKWRRRRRGKLRKRALKALKKRDLR